MYSVVVEKFLRNKNAVVVSDKSLVPFGYPALTFEVESDNNFFWRMVGGSSKTVLSIDNSTLMMTIAIPAERDIDWEEELKRLSVKEPIVAGNMLVYTIRLKAKITPLAPSHSQVSDK